MKSVFFVVVCALALLCTLAAESMAGQPYWEPEQPIVRDTITVYLPGFQEGDVLHWGVTVDDISWTRPIDAYIPKGSTMFGDAVRTPFKFSPQDFSLGVVEFGPFDHPDQRVGTIDFAVSYADGTWNNNDGEDFSIPVSAGRISISPERPGVNDPVTVTVHDVRPGALLRWGLNADRGSWTPVDPVYYPEGAERADDGVGTDTPLPPPDDNGNSVLVLGPFNRGEQVVRSLHMAVHWKGVWDTDNGRNYNFELDWRDGPDGLRLLQPAENTVATDQITVEVQNPGQGPVSLWLDGKHLTTLSRPPFEYPLILDALELGAHRLTARSGSDARATIDSVTFWRVPSVQTLPLPEGVSFGAVDHGDGRVTFALYAPGKKFVELAGDFDPAQAGEERYVMHATPDGVWWLTLPLEPGAYAYQYIIESDMRLGDPYAHEVDWTNEKGQKGWKAKDARAVVRAGKEPFDWTAEGYRRPALDELVIYELFIEDFAPGEGFDGVTERLDYIADLGVNAIEPLPWHPWPGKESWGYNPAFHFAVDPYYGNPERLKHLINESHKRGIAVIIDMVLNHAEWSSPIHMLYGRDYDASPYFRQFTGHNWGFPKIDQQSPAVKRYTADLIRHWIENYRIDGFRYDATRWVGWSGYNDWGASWYAYSANRVDPDNYQIAEHLPIEPPLITDTEMDTGWHAEYRWRIREMLNNGKLDSQAFKEVMDARQVGFTHPLQRIP
ncbi:MAG: hypothetical protein EOM20_20025, partial [Spartobacteria bacterium]|nr:hypothetical protein [Spartobacteria bacterium]